jgi:hypothetical protein
MNLHSCNPQPANQPQTISAQQNTYHIRTNNQKHYRNNKHKDEQNKPKHIIITKKNNQERNNKTKSH